MNIWPKLLLIISLIGSIRCLNQDFASKFIGNAKRNADKVSVANNKISKLRLILMSDLKQNEISPPLDSCWSTSQAIKITAKSCPCNEINCSAPTNNSKRRLINSSCMQICCGNRVKKTSIRSLSEAHILELRKFSVQANCERANTTGSFIFARIYEKFNDKSICAGVLVHQKFILTTAICVLNKKSSDLIIKFGSDQHGEVKEIITHPNFYRSIETLQDNIALLMLEQEITEGELPCIKTKMDIQNCHVFSWGSSKLFENMMKVDKVEVLKKGECYTSHLISGKKHEKYVNKGNNNICAGNKDRYELDINLSGSTLVCQQENSSYPPVLKGLLTWSTKINTFPYIFTDITRFDRWIEQKINEKYLNF